jgi:hypothetical protein
LLAVVDRLNNVANRIIGRTENLSDAVVDRLFSNVDHVSNLLADIRNLVPNRAAGLL